MLKAASNSAGRRRNVSSLRFRICRRQTTTVLGKLGFRARMEKGAVDWMSWLLGKSLKE